MCGNGCSGSVVVFGDGSGSVVVSGAIVGGDGVVVVEE